MSIEEPHHRLLCGHEVLQPAWKESRQRAPANAGHGTKRNDAEENGPRAEGAHAAFGALLVSLDVLKVEVCIPGALGHEEPAHVLAHHRNRWIVNGPAPDHRYRVDRPFERVLARLVSPVVAPFLVVVVVEPRLIGVLKLGSRAGLLVVPHLVYIQHTVDAGEYDEGRARCSGQQQLLERRQIHVGDTQPMLMPPEFRVYL